MLKSFTDAYQAEYHRRPLWTVAITTVVASSAFVALIVGAFVIPYWLDAPTRERDQRTRASLDSALSVPRSWPAISLRDLGSAVATLRTTCSPNASGFMGTLRYDLQIAPADSIITRLGHFSIAPSRFVVAFYGGDGFKTHEVVVDAARMQRTYDPQGRTALVANDAGGWCDRDMLAYRSWNISYSLPTGR